MLKQLRNFFKKDEPIAKITPENCPPQYSMTLEYLSPVSLCESKEALKEKSIRKVQEFDELKDLRKKYESFKHDVTLINVLPKTVRTLLIEMTEFILKKYTPYADCKKSCEPNPIKSSSCAQSNDKYLTLDEIAKRYGKFTRRHYQNFINHHVLSSKYILKDAKGNAIRKPFNGSGGASKQYDYRKLLVFLSQNVWKHEHRDALKSIIKQIKKEDAQKCQKN